MRGICGPPHKRPVLLSFDVFFRTNCWTNGRVACNLRCHGACDIIVMWLMNDKEMYVTPVCKQWKFISVTLLQYYGTWKMPMIPDIFCFVVVRKQSALPISFRVTSLALGQSYDWSNSEGYRQINHIHPTRTVIQQQKNKAEHNKVHILWDIMCIKCIILWDILYMNVVTKK